MEIIGIIAVVCFLIMVGAALAKSNDGKAVADLKTRPGIFILWLIGFGAACVVFLSECRG